ncbi:MULTISPECIES: hypothetical protein [Bacillaceae]|nr:MULTISPECIES: hypothetical protein [Bacillaceae]
MEKLTKLLNKYGKYLFAYQMAVKPCSKSELEFMIKMFRNN